MANSKISALTSATTPLAGTEVLPIVQSGATTKVTVANLTAGRAVSAVSYSATGAISTTYSGISYNVSTGASGTNAIYQLTNGTQTVRFAIAADNSVYVGTISNDPFNILINGSKAWTYDVSNNLVPLNAAKGINFTANTPAAGMTSQLLNWYEEGSYTPTVTSGTGSITSYSVTAQYTRIGRQVTVCFEVVISNNGTGGGSVVVTMPFTCGAQPSVGVGRENGVTGNILQAILPASSSVAYVLTATNGYPGANGYKPTCTITYFV